MTATRRVTLHVRLVAATQGRTCDREALHTGFYASPRASRASCLQQTEALRGTRRDVEMGDRLQGHLAASQLSQWETPKYPCPRIHCPPGQGALPCLGRISLTSGRRKERQLGPPGPVRTHSFPPFLSPDPASPATCPVSAKQEPCGTRSPENRPGASTEPGGGRELPGEAGWGGTHPASPSTTHFAPRHTDPGPTEQEASPGLREAVTTPWPPPLRP